MGVLTDDMKKLIKDNRLGFVATASKKGIPNVSPKGSLRVVDDNTLAFVCIWSQKTINNLQENPNIAVAVLDPKAGKGFQFKGTATLENSGNLFDEGTALMAKMKLPKPKFVARIAVAESHPIMITI